MRIVAEPWSSLRQCSRKRIWEFNSKRVPGGDKIGEQRGREAVRHEDRLGASVRASGEERESAAMVGVPVVLTAW